ncbi:MAG: efflux RND transporter permease subunit [Planctomycetes bacterium]|nr:efflux RND transporter permease subunit [Planctomycetota bacterium]
MQGLASVCIRRPVFAAMLIAGLVVAGATGYVHLPVDRYPQVDLPQVSVRATMPGASPEEMEVSVSQPLEEAVNTIEGIEELRSISGQGTSIVLLTFSLDRDIDVAAQDVRDRVATVLGRLPRDIEPPIVGKFDNDSQAILTVAVAGQRSIRELTELADKQVKPFLERASGVGEVRMVGGVERAVDVAVDAERLAAYGLTIQDVREALQRQNVDIPGGLLTEVDRERTLRTLGRYVDPRSFADLVIETRGNAPVRIKDVGTVTDGTKEPRSLARLDGVPTVILEMRRQSNANTVLVIDACKQALERTRAALPGDVHLDVILDQSRYIRAALDEIDLHLLLGSILASLVVLAFMRSWRSTLIAAIAIPTSVVSTFGVMWAFGFTLNGVTMLALVLMVGIVIDDAIVVLENVFRFVEEKGMPPMQAAKEATSEIALAVLATTLSLVVIFVPVSFMSSISGRFLFQFGITAAAAVLVSLLVSFTLTPTMSARLLKQDDAAKSGAVARSRRGLYGVVERSYLALLGMAMRHRFAVIVLCLLVVASSVPLYGLVRQDYIPSGADQGEFDVQLRGPEGASLTAMEHALVEVEAELRSIPGVTNVLTQAGGSFLSGVNRGSFYVRLAPHESRVFSLPRLFEGLLAFDPGAAFRGNFSQTDVMTEVRKRLRKHKELRGGPRNLRSFNIGGGNYDIDFVVLGPDLERLVEYGDRLADAATAAGGIVDIDTTLNFDAPELRVEIDRERAADLGVSTQDIATALRVMVGGDPRVSRFRDPALDEEYDVQLRLALGDRDDPRELGSLLVPRRGGDPIRLDNLVRVDDAVTASRIDRLDRARQNSLRATVGPGHALADRIEVLRRAADDLQMPSAYTTRISGRARELERTFDEFVVAFGLSLVFMYMILASQFESLLHPLTILASLPIAMPFALLSLWASGDSLNLYSALGMLVLFGVVKKNSILQVDHVNQLRRAGVPRDEAILRGNRDRLRPILMTTFALVAGMLPLAVGTGPGAEERRAVAVVVIGGQTLALLLTLLATPVVYSVLDDLRRRRLDSGTP